MNLNIFALIFALIVLLIVIAGCASGARNTTYANSPGHWEGYQSPHTPGTIPGVSP